MPETFYLLSLVARCVVTCCVEQHLRQGLLILVLVLFAGTAQSQRSGPEASARSDKAAPDWVQPVDEREMRPYPEDGARPSENPPSFRWRRRDSGDVYEVIIDLEDGGQIRRMAATNVLALKKPLPEGRHSWQVRRWAAFDKADGWSRKRTFTIVPGTPARLILSPTEAFDFAAGRGRPRLLPPDPQRSLTIADAYVGWKREFFDAVEKRLFRDRQALPATDGNLSGVGATQMTREELVALRRDIRASVNRVMRTIYDGMLVWIVTKDIYRGDPGLEEAAEAMRWLASLDPLGTTSNRVSDLLNLRIAVTLATAYDILHDKLDPIDRIRILSVIEDRIQQTFDAFVVDESRALAAYPFNSHGFRHSLGILAVSAILAGETPRARSWFNATYPLFTGVGNPWGGDDGGYANGINYGTWDILHNLEYWDALRNITGIDYFGSGWARQASMFLQYIIPPGTPSSGFGDGAEDFKPLVWSETIRMLFERTRVPEAGHLYVEWAEFLSGNRSDLPELEDEFASWTFLLGAGAPPAAIDTTAEVVKNLPDSAIFPSIGWAAMHSDLADVDRFSILFKSSPYGSFSHSHADQNSFIINGRRQRIAIDSGYYDTYKSRHHLAWTTETVAHNAITFDGGKGQPWNSLDAQGRLESFISCPGYDAVTGDATQAYAGELLEARRTLLYLRPDQLLVHDRLRSTEPRQFEWNIHALDRMEFEGHKGISLRTSDASVCVRQIHGPETVFSQSDTFPIEPSRELQPDWQPQWHGQFRTRQKQENMDWLFLVSFDCNGGTATQVTRLESGALQLGIDGRRVTIGAGRTSVMGADEASCRIPPPGRPLVAAAGQMPKPQDAEALRAVRLRLGR